MRRNDAARTPVEESLVDALREAGRARAGSK
jgi:LysR family transcriptional regulator, pca operon transcriptional activator